MSKNYFRDQTGYFQCKATYKLDTNIFHVGFAEGKKVIQAELRAIAEAYERCCYAANFSSVERGEILKYPHGIGCGITYKRAARRAFGEYYERMYYRCFDHSNNAPLTSFDTKYGKIWISRNVFESSMGTGYGFNKFQAFDSAKRSAIRRKNLGQPQLEIFKSTNCPLKVYNLTPTKNQWIHCVMVAPMVENLP